MSKTPTEFVRRYNGVQIDWDGVYGTQCVDGWKVFLEWAGIPVRATPNGWADSIWTCKNADGSLNEKYQAWTDKNFERITDPEALQDGDWCIWGKGSSCNLSHVAMYYKGSFFGERQGGNNEFRFIDLKKDILGALRWKKWEISKGFEIPAGKTVTSYEGQKIIIYGQRDGQRLGMISASGEKPLTALQRIENIDSDQVVIYASMNANYFQMLTDQSDPYGTHYGTEISLTNQFCPHKGNMMAYAIMNDGKSFAAPDSEFWYNRTEVRFACAPAYVAYLRGNKVNLWSQAFKHTKAGANTQSMLIRTADRFALAVCSGQLTVDQCVKWAEGIDGLMDLCFFDSGGSSQIMIGHEVPVYTGRMIPNVLALYYLKGEEPTETEIPEEPGADPETDDRDRKILELEAEVKALRERIEKIRKIAEEGTE